MAGETIQLLTRYNVGARRDPRENRLTAALAALLSESPALAQRLARAWLDDDVTGAVSTTFQRPIGGNRGWIDLELAVADSPHRRIWVEAKLGSHLSGNDQLEIYKERISTFGPPTAERLVLLLVPAQRAADFKDIPRLTARHGVDQGPYLVTWQQLYGVLERGGERRERRHINWLRKEVLGYMAIEGLQATKLNATNVKALQNIEQAWAAIDALIQNTSEILEESGWRVKRPLGADRKSTYWETRYRPSHPGAQVRRGTRACLAWGISGGEAFAGVYFACSAGGEVRPPRDDEWFANLREHWDLDEGENRNEIWAGDSRRLTDFHLSASIDAQATEMAKFVEDAFAKAVAGQS